MKKITLSLLMLAASIGIFAQDMTITGAYDGPLSGGHPKGIELYVINNIADLSIYGVGSANNGGGTDGEEFTFPAVAVTSGQFIYVTADSAGFRNFMGFDADYTSGAMGINGDDAIELFTNGSVTDVFGDINLDGSGTAWDYLDGWASRVNCTGPEGSTFTVGNWTYSGTNVLDGETTNATAATPIPIGVYSTLSCASTISVSFASSTASQMENIISNDTVWINLAAAATQNDTINVTLNDISATHGTDYSTTPDISAGSDYFITSGDSSIMIIVNMIDDVVYEGNETFSMSINSVTSGLSMGSTTTLTYTITENDAAPPSDLLISGVFDATLSGGVPKGIELFVLNNVADLSIYGIGSANNGGGSDGEEFTFPAVSANAGDYIYITNDSTGFNTFFGFNANYESSIMNINGDDAVELFLSGSVADVYGDINQDGTNQPWEFLDGWAYRYNCTGPDGSTFTIANWILSGKNVLDGESSNATASTPLPIASYSSTVCTMPESVSFITSTDSRLENITSNDTIWINLDSAASTTDSIYVSSTDISATYGTDYSTTPDISSGAILSIAIGDSTAMVIVNMIDDVIFEGNETFTISIDSTTNGLSVGSPALLTYTITENETGPIPVSFASSTGSRMENITSNDTIWINLASVAVQADTINVSLTDISATYNTDYSTTPNISTAVDFPVAIGESAIMVIVNMIDDLAFEGDETFSITINSVTSGLSMGAITTQTYTITENDVLAGTYPMFPIATVTTEDGTGVADSLAVDCRLTGVVYGENFRASSTGITFTLIDNTGGIACFSNPATYGYTVAEGDSIVVEGNIGQFNGLIQLYLDTIILVSSGNSLKAPTVVTSLGEATESDLIKFDSLNIITPSQWTGSGSGFNVDVTDGTNTFSMRIDNDCDLFSMPVPNYAFSLKGIGGQYDASSPYDAGYQIYPRRATDIDSLGTAVQPPLDSMDATPNCTGNTVVSTYMFKDFEDLDLTSRGWTNQTVVGTTDWYVGSFMGSSYAKISNYDNGAGANIAAEAWLISPSLNISSAFSPIVNFMNLSKFDGDQVKLMVSTNYSGTGDPNSASWTDLTASADWDTDLSDWGNFVCSGDIGLGSYKSTSTYVAFKYIGSNSDGTTWEIDDISVFDTDALSIADEIKTNLTVYPNPTNNVLNINLLTNDKSTISILDLSGKNIVSVSTTKLNNSISVESLENGIYFIEVKSDNGTYRTKFVKN